MNATQQKLTRRKVLRLAVVGLLGLDAAALAVPDRQARDVQQQNYPQFPDAHTCEHRLREAEKHFQAMLQVMPDVPDALLRDADKVISCWGYAWKLQLKRADGFYPHLTNAEWRKMQLDSVRHLENIIGVRAFARGELPIPGRTQDGVGR
jgi:hypothetical protein